MNVNGPQFCFPPRECRTVRPAEIRDIPSRYPTGNARDALPQPRTDPPGTPLRGRPQTNTLETHGGLDHSAPSPQTARTEVKPGHHPQPREIRAAPTPHEASPRARSSRHSAANDNRDTQATILSDTPNRSPTHRGNTRAITRLREMRTPPTPHGTKLQPAVHTASLISTRARKRARVRYAAASTTGHTTAVTRRRHHPRPRDALFPTPHVASLQPTVHAASSISTRAR